MISSLNITVFQTKTKYWYLAVSSALLLIFTFLWRAVPFQGNQHVAKVHLDTASPETSQLNTTIEAIRTTSESFQVDILPETHFGELGSRLQTLRQWVSLYDQLPVGSPEGKALSDQIEGYAVSEFPFLKRSDAVVPPLETLRKKHAPGTKGIVIAAGKHNFRFCCHLVTCLRDVLHSKLPIQVAYAGDDDLPPSYRQALGALGEDIETSNVLDTFDDATLDLARGGWAIKPFAMLASRFEQTILVDADAVFVQPPESILESHLGYREHGALFFHDRLLWQGAFPERHRFWEHEMEHHTPSETLLKSKVYMEGYAEEADSGVVVVDKGRLAHFVGLLHVCWQNAKATRERVTYQRGYGDKESWWFGLELSGAAYAFEEHYGSIVGEEKTANGVAKVCGFTIAHVDQRRRLLWYNGSLLKNKAVNDTEYIVPTRWMIDGTWEKGAAKPDMSCMRGAEVRTVEREELGILRASVEAAQKIDKSVAMLSSGK